MSKRKVKPFHTTESIGLNFTDEEWWAHCEDVRHGRKSDIAFEFHGFKYNYNDICLNPKEVFSWQGKKTWNLIQITISESPDGWSYGLDVNLGTRGTGQGCSFVNRGDKDWYETADAAFEAAIGRLSEIREQEVKNAEFRQGITEEDDDDRLISKSIGGEFRQAIKVIESLEAQIKEPTLFGYF